MRILIIANPRSGVGRGRSLAARHAIALRRAGFSVNVLETGTDTDDLMRHGLLDGVDVLVAVGGDGTVHHAAEIVKGTDLAIYHVPLGNENLFAREFGMSRSRDRLVSALHHNRRRKVDLGEANGKVFVIMAGIGLDASLIHRLARARTRAIGHSSYVEPGLRELMRPCLPAMSITVDGERIVEDRRGVALIANSRRYGVDLDPARHAEIDDGRLDLVFMPCKTRLGVLGWALDARLGWHLERRRLVYRPGTEISITTNGDAAPVQLDGEAPGVTPESANGNEASVTPLRVRVLPGALTVLDPGHV